MQRDCSSGHLERDDEVARIGLFPMARTAVNLFFKRLVVELKEKGVVVTILHPGFTNTNLSSEIKKIPGVVEPNVSAAGLCELVQKKTLGDMGKFWHRDGMKLSW